MSTAAMPLASFLAKLVGSKPVVRLLSNINVAIYRASAGRLMGSIDGSPVCLVTMTRHRSGRLATIPLMYTPHDNEVLLVASLGGAPVHPAWYFNLRARPQIELQVGGVRRAMRAREASPGEHAALWPEVVASFPAYADYQRKTERRIPIFVCSPVPA